jgi:hypothetical protein
MPTFGLADIVRAAKLTLLQKKKEMLEEEGSVRRHSVRSEEKNMKKGRKTAQVRGRSSRRSAGSAKLTDEERWMREVHGRRRWMREVDGQRRWMREVRG